MEYKETRKLFYGTYRHKIVLLVGSSFLFREKDVLLAIERHVRYNSRHNIKLSKHNSDVLEYAVLLATTLNTLTDFKIRIESPYISIYSNNESDILTLKDLNINNVIRVYNPIGEVDLEKDTIILPKVPFDYKVTINSVHQRYPEFVEWAFNLKKARMTRSCRQGLIIGYSYSSVYFYISGDNNLLLAKLHLGNSISKIEKIVKS